MIHDQDTNIVFLSEWLQKEFKDFFERFTSLMEEAGIRWEFLKNTNDYWARDYMPVQLEENDFVKYRYEPDYLRKPGNRQYITNCARTCKNLGITYRETDIIIDGGNMVPCGDYVVMTNKVFSENNRPENDPELVLKLERLFGHKVIIIPWHSAEGDEFGHADGFIKYVGGNKILMGNHRESEPEEAEDIHRELEDHGFKVTELKFDVKKPNPDLNWAYINFLQVGKVIIMPTFGIDEDEQARTQIQDAFLDCKIYGLRLDEKIALEGGALHCLTWNIKR